MRTKEEYENLINNSPLFDIDKISNSELYKTERSKLFILLTEYYQAYIYKHKRLEDYGYTLIETAAECLKDFDKSKGEFLNLFNWAMNRDSKIAEAKEREEARRQGIKLSADDKVKIRKIIKLAKSKNLDYHDTAVQASIATLLGISKKEVAELIYINDNAVAVPDLVKNDEGDEVSLSDSQADKTETREKTIIDEESLIEHVKEIDSVFKDLQDRQKELISLLLTKDIFKSFGYDVHKTISLLQDTAFYNDKIIQWYEKEANVPTAKQIAEMCGVSEQSLSRTYKNFKEKLKENIKF